MENDESKNCWFVAVVTPNTELRCEERLASLVRIWKENKMIESSETVTSYVPIQRVIRIQPSTGCRVQTQKVLTPCYVFIRCGETLRYKIASEAKFVHHFLMDRASQTKSGRNDFARIPNGQMESFKRMVEEAEKAVTIDSSRLRVGDRVRIKTGRLAGLEGNICQEPNGSTMLALRVDFLGYAKMQCSTDILELVKE